MKGKQSDLNPPLGWRGGPCLVVDRIEEEVRNPRTRAQLSDKVERGKSLTNPEAAEIYDVETEQGIGLFKRIRISRHAQYRMDLRGVTVGDIKVALKHFAQQLNDWKSRDSWEYQDYIRTISHEAYRWVDARLGDLVVVFKPYGRDTVDIISTFWKGLDDPNPQSCGLLPRNASSCNRWIGPVQFGAVVDVPHRTPGVPGEDAPAPQEEVRPYPRPGRLAVQVRQTPSHRQHKQRGRAKLKDQQWYRRNRGKVKQRAKRRYNVLKRQPSFKRQQSIRRQHPERFKRRVGTSLTSPDLSFAFLERGFPTGTFRNFSGLTGEVTFFADRTQMLGSLPLREFLYQVVFLSPEEEDVFFDLLDDEMGISRQKEARFDIRSLPEECRKVLYVLVKTDLWRRFQQGLVRDIDVLQWLQKSGWSKLTLQGMHRLFGHLSRQAARISDLQNGLGVGIQEKARSVPFRMVRSDEKNAVWLFDAQGSEGTYRVRLKALRKGNLQDIRKAHVKVSCSCPFWKWQGPEYWAVQGNYLYGSPQGTATRPKQKDPTGQHGVCKHVAAILAHVQKQGWVLPPVSRKAHYFADTTLPIEKGNA